MSYRVLIVDDESGIAEGLRFLIERYVPECTVAGVAFNGKQGYESAMELQPDLILTDIRMPEMDGIEMTDLLKRAGFNGRFIILSGYAEFSYAQRAIRLGVDEYITKPVEEEELVEVFGRACKAVKEEQERRQNVEKITDDLEHYNQSMKAYILKDLLVNSHDDVKEELGSLGFPLTCKRYSCIVFENSGENQEGSRDLLLSALEAQAAQYLDFCETKIIIPYLEAQAMVIMAFDKELEYRSYLSILGKLRLKTAEKTKLNISAGTSLFHYKVGQIRDAFEEARCALNYKVIKGSGAVISYEELRNLTGKSRLIDEGDVARLEKCIDTMDDDGCRQVIEEIFRKIEKEKNVNLNDLQSLSLNLVLTGIRKMPFMQLQLNGFLGRNILSLESISKFQTMEQLKNWIINTLKGMNELMLKESMPEKRDLVEEAKEYMRKNFNKEISLNDISERFFINPYYFSQLFKKKTGQTYQNYLTELRVSRAKKLFVETDLKIYEVCSMVGYTDTNHFNKVFERIVGVKPSEFKKQG